jgi:uncharacterized protein YjdB
MLFLNYLRHQLNIATADIVLTAGNTLAATCQTITGEEYPFPHFALLLHVHYPPGVAVGSIPYDNPFPLDLPTVELTGLAHLQDVGDVGWQNDKFVGTQGQSRRLEGFELSIEPAIAGLGMEYMAHIENIGDMNWVGEGHYIGTRGHGSRLEGFAIKLTGPVAPQYTVMYMANVQDVGLTAFAADGEFCGTRGLSRQVEGMLVHIQPK